MGEKNWTKAELNYLENKVGILSTEAIGKALGRSTSSVALKQHRLGLGGYLANTESLNKNNICQILGIEYKTLQRYERNGLLIRRRSGIYSISQENLLRWLKNNQDLWNAARVTDESIFADAKWYKSKKEADKGRQKSREVNFTQEEISRMNFLYYNKAYSVQQVADELGRSYCSIRSKLHRERSKRRKAV